MHAAGELVSFLFEFIPAAVVAPVIVAVVVTLLELLIPVFPVVLVVTAIVISRIGDIAICFTRFIWPETLDIGGIGKFQLTIGDLGQLTLDGVVVYGFLMPVVIGQFHVIGDGVGKSIALVRILFRK